MIAYGRILTTGTQSLLALAAGWAAGRYKALDAEPAVAQLNLFVLRVCIPALQLWLLAVKTDMRRGDNWRVLGAFLLWSVLLQALAAAWQLFGPPGAGEAAAAAAATAAAPGGAPSSQPQQQQQQRGRRGRALDAARLAVDSLALTTNNTGILGPVVLEAALGAKFAPLGMLATVVLYFQQLPSAAVLFDLAARQRRRRGGGEADAEAVALLGGHTGSANGLKALGDGAPAVAAAAAEQQQRQQQQHYRAKASPQPSAAEGELEAAGAGSDPEWAAGGPAHHRHPHHQQPHSNSQRGSSRRPLRPKAPEAPGAAAVTVAAAEADSEGGGAAALLLMAQNPMVWSTAAALALSCLGSSALLDPASPARLALLAPIEPLLAWFAGCAAPVTLFCTGLWAEAQPPGAAPARGEVAAYLALRATLCPALMAGLARLLGFRGDAAAALVVLALLPVAQTAFVVCKQYDEGTHAVTALMVASLLAMLPQLVVVLAALEALGAFAP